MIVYRDWFSLYMCVVIFERLKKERTLLGHLEVSRTIVKDLANDLQIDNPQRRVVRETLECRAVDRNQLQRTASVAGL